MYFGRFILSRRMLFVLLFTVLTLFHGNSNTRARDLLSYNNKNDVFSHYYNIDRLGRSFRSWVRKNTNSNIVPSVTSGIVYNDKLVFQDGYNADIDTQFSIASLTKTFTGILILKLAENGYLKIDEPVQKYLPGVIMERGSSFPTIKIRHLLSHSSGMETGQRAGEHYRYSNRSFVILKMLIEKVTGSTFADILDSEIFSPLGMHSSHGRHSNGTGGLITTLRDLTKYATMLINNGAYSNGRIILEQTYKNMLVPIVRIPRRSKPNYYSSLSWEVTMVDNKVESYYKAGRWFGAASVLQVFPEKKAALIFLCNPPNHQSGAFFGWRYKINTKLIEFINEISGDSKRVFGWNKLTDDIIRNYIGEKKVKELIKSHQLSKSSVLKINNASQFMIGKSY